MRYGTVPVVRRTGGLKDTVAEATQNALLDRTAMRRRVRRTKRRRSHLQGATQALALYSEPLLWRRLQLQGMSQDFSWARSALRYAALYRDAAPGAAATTRDVGAAEIVAPAAVHAA